MDEKKIRQHIKSALESYQEIEMWELVREMVENEHRQHLIDLVIRSGVKDMMFHADSVLDLMERKAMMVKRGKSRG